MSAFISFLRLLDCHYCDIRAKSFAKDARSTLEHVLFLDPGDTFTRSILNITQTLIRSVVSRDYDLAPPNLEDAILKKAGSCIKMKLLLVQKLKKSAKRLLWCSSTCVDINYDLAIRFAEDTKSKLEQVLLVDPSDEDARSELNFAKSIIDYFTSM